MKKTIHNLLVLASIAILCNFSILAGDQIVMSADGKIQKATQAKKKKPTKEDSQNSKTKKKKRIAQKPAYASIASMPEAKVTQSTSTKVPDIILAPDTLGETFRLHVKTKLSPAFAIIAARNGFFLIMDKKYNIQLPELTQNLAFIKNINIIDNPTLLILRFVVEPHINANLENNKDNTYLNFFYRDAASTFVQAPTPALFSIEEKKWPNIVIKPLLPGGTGAFVTLVNSKLKVHQMAE